MDDVCTFFPKDGVSTDTTKPVVYQRQAITNWSSYYFSVLEIAKNTII